MRLMMTMHDRGRETISASDESRRRSEDDLRHDPSLSDAMIKRGMRGALHRLHRTPGMTSMISGVAIMTDTDNTNESAEAYYGDIAFKKRPE